MSRKRKRDLFDVLDEVATVLRAEGVEVSLDEFNANRPGLVRTGEPTADEAQHNWSGWPGAWCLDCGVENPLEKCLALGHDSSCTACWVDPCPCPGAGNFNPYKVSE